MATAKRTKTTAKKTAAKKTAAKKATASQTAAKKKANAKAAAEAKAKEVAAKADAAEKSLNPVAKDINTRLEKAKKYADQADDMRLAASLRLADAKKVCDDNGLKFREWVEAHIEYGWENARKLERIGRDGETEARKALADLRAKSALAQQKQRDKAKSGQKQITSSSSSGPKKTELQTAEEALDRLNENGRRNFIDSAARKQGMVAIPADEYNNMTKTVKSVTGASGSKLDMAKATFDALSAPDKMKLATYACEVIGAEVKMPDFGGESDDPLDIPENLRRDKPAAKKATASRNRKKAA